MVENPGLRFQEFKKCEMVYLVLVKDCSDKINDFAGINISLEILESYGLGVLSLKGLDSGIIFTVVVVKCLIELKTP